MILSPASSSMSAPKLSGATSQISTPRRRMFVTAGVTANSYIRTYCATDLRVGKIRNTAGVLVFLYRVCDFKHLPLLMKNLILLPLLASLVCASFISVSAQETTGALPINAPIKASVTAAASTPEPSPTEIYRVGVGDVLDIRLLNSANSKSTLFTFVAGGLIELPIAGGTISVAGLTPDEDVGRGA